jgi:hypothetical protein
VHGAAAGKMRLDPELFALQIFKMPVAAAVCSIQHSRDDAALQER